MEKMRIQTPNAVSPSRCRINGDKKMPTATSVDNENQLDPTFLMIRRLLILLIPLACSELLGQPYSISLDPRGHGFRVQFAALQFVAKKIHQRKPRHFNLLDEMRR